LIRSASAQRLHLNRPAERPLNDGRNLIVGKPGIAQHIDFAIDHFQELTQTESTDCVAGGPSQRHSRHYDLFHRIRGLVRGHAIPGALS
jgi:hypothetical protein